MIVSGSRFFLACAKAASLLRNLRRGSSLDDWLTQRKFLRTNQNFFESNLQEGDADSGIGTRSPQIQSPYVCLCVGGACVNVILHYSLNMPPPPLSPSPPLPAPALLLSTPS